MFLCLFFLMAILQSAEAGSAGVYKWKKLGEYTETYSGGSTERFAAVEETRGVMDHTGKVRNPRTRTFILSVDSSYDDKALAFLSASPDVWFVKSSWSSLFWPSDPPLGYNVPRGLEVVGSFPQDSSNSRYDVVEPVKAGTLRFMIEPQDASVPVSVPAGVYELEAWVLAGAGEVTVQWFEVDRNGNAHPRGIPFLLVNEKRIWTGVSAGLYYVEVTQGRKTIRSRTARVGSQLAGHQDQIDPSDQGAIIQGKVWKDINENDIDDAEDEPGFPGLEVTLLDWDANGIIVGRATTGRDGDYQFQDVPLKDPDEEGYVVRWQVPEYCHVARPYIGGNTALDCDAANASSLIEAPTTGPLSADSALILPVIPGTISDVDLGLFEMPTLRFVEPSTVVMESDSDQTIEIPFKLSKPVRYTPLNIFFRTWRFQKDGADDQVDYWQENPVTTTVPAGTVDGILRFTIAGDDATEGIESFFVELDRLINSHKVDTTGKKMPLHQVSIIDDDVKLPASDDLFREYVTADGNRFQTAGLQGYPNYDPYFWNLDMSLSTNGKPSFRTNPTNGLGAHAVLTSLQAKGPRDISFEWRLSGSADDVMMVFFQNTQVDYGESNPPHVTAELSGSTGWQAVSAQIPEGHLLNLSVFKGGADAGNVYGQVRNLDLGGPDTPPTAPQPESLDLTGLDEVQEPEPDGERRQWFSSVSGAGAYSGAVETSPNSQDAAGSLSRISVSKKGSFVARASVEGKRNVVRGSFNEVGKFSTLLTARDGSSRALLLQVQTDVSGGNQEIVGTLETGDGSSSKIVLQKPLSWKKGIDPCPFKGRYLLILPQRAGGAPHAPTGDGWGTLTVSDTGRVRILLTLGDGTRVAAGSSVTPEGRIPLDRKLYRGKGSLSGFLQVREVADVSDLDGSLRWLKSANPKSRHQPEGFDSEVAAVGSFHDPSLVVPFPDLLDDGPWEVSIELSSGDFLSEPMTMPVVLRRRGNLVLIKEVAPEPPLKPFRLLRGNINLKTGLVGFVYTDRFLKKRTGGRGVLFQKQNTMAGFLSGRSAFGSFHLIERPALR